MDKIKSIKRLRQRFCKDFNLPINIFEDHYFNYYMTLYDFFPSEMWEYVIFVVREKYDWNVEEWLNYCAAFRDRAIEETMNSDAYKKFNEEDMSKWDIDPSVPKIGEHSIFNDEGNGKAFVSIDMKKANFQALKYAGVFNDETYEDFVKRFGGDRYIAESKYLRQVIFGKMNPGRTIKVEKYLMGEIYKFVFKTFDSHFYDFYSFNSDELIFKQRTPYDFLSKEEAKKMENDIKEKFGIEVRVENILVRDLNIVNCNLNKVDAYERTNLYTGEKKLKKASTTYYPQIYKIWKGDKLYYEDLVFWTNDQLAVFEKFLMENKDEDISKQ